MILISMKTFGSRWFGVARVAWDRVRLPVVGSVCLGWVDGAGDRYPGRIVTPPPLTAPRPAQPAPEIRPI